VRPSGIFTTAPLLQMSVTGTGSSDATGCVKWKLRPVTRTTSTPRETAAASASRCAAGSVPRLSSSVPSMSIARRRMPSSS
jgi:hypothetical protein